MDIALLSTALSQMKIQQQASLSVMKMAMDASKTQSSELFKMAESNTKMMEQSVNSHIGGNIDTKI